MGLTGIIGFYNKRIKTFYLFIFIFVLSSFSGIFAQSIDELFLYDTTTKVDEEYKYNEKGEITHVFGDVNPRLLIYRPENPNGTGIIICPGGGYSRMNIENTKFIAERLNRLGITAFVLVYRLPIHDTTPLKSIAALQDVQKAFLLVRQKANLWGLDNNKIGLWGSSAGGHLAAMAATHFNESFIDENNSKAFRPDFLILAWPVISFRDEFVHKGSMKNLLGNSPSLEQIAYYSANESVCKSTPPTFLIHATDDLAVSVENSILFYQALKRSGVSAEMHLFQKGGHGFGIEPGAKNTWFNLLEMWLKRNSL